jgi:hypothetical protein
MSVGMLCILVHCCNGAGIWEVLFKKFFDLFQCFLSILFSVPTEDATVMSTGLAAAARGV